MDRAQAFFERLGFAVDGKIDSYRMTSDGLGASIRLTVPKRGWLR